MIFGANQAYFMPYLGYWQLINAVDVYGVADNYNYIKRGWVNRNRVLGNMGPRYLTLPIVHASRNRFIMEHELAPFDADTMLHQLSHEYRSAPNFDAGLDLMERVLRCKKTNLADFLFDSIELTCHYLGIDTRLIRTSDLPQDPSLRLEQRLYDYCDQLQADTYYNPIGGTALYSFEDFRAHGIKLAFVRCHPVPYPQVRVEEFVPNLSIVDVIMNTSRQEAHDMLASFDLITEERS